jgi:hypothetical protein
MNDTPTPDEVRAAIVPKSDQLNADDLLTGPITVTITATRTGDRKQPIVIEIEGQRPFKPCKTMLRVISEVFTADAENWVGQQMTLYRDPEVMLHGVIVGGIRISHLSNLSEPMTFLVTLKRGQRTKVTVYPIDTLSLEDREYIEQVKKDIAEAESLETLKAYGFVLKQKSKAIQDALRPAYSQRQQELSKPNPTGSE